MDSFSTGVWVEILSKEIDYDMRHMRKQTFPHLQFHFNVVL